MTNMIYVDVHRRENLCLHTRVKSLSTESGNWQICNFTVVKYDDWICSKIVEWMFLKLPIIKLR